MNSESASRTERALPGRISYPGDLPVAERRQEIAEALAAHQVIVVAGETGSGKTTQLPKICLELGRGRLQRIGHTQPRRLAARTVAQRIADELGVSLGGLVGYQVRFHDAVSDDSAIKLMTDGILLSELSRDRDLSQYDTLIIDEAHERSLNIDFILGYLKRLLPRRPDLKVIVTSATIDEERFAGFFDDAPIIRVSGRTYPVETHYLLAAGETVEDPLSLIEETVAGVRAGQWGAPGDVLIFLSGERDIRDLARRLRPQQGLDVLPLYARLSQAEQARVFGGGSRRGLRVVLATNVAETSVTVPGIRYVIDPGEARISRFSHRTRVQRLPIEAVSQASADQRRGRCGRVGPGVCLRLYSEADYLARPRFTDPEIKRSNLAAVVLQMLQLGLGKIERYPFIEAPDQRLVRDGFRLLQELGALDERERLTRLGRRMAAFPVDPSLARMLLAAEREGVLPELLVIASALAIQDPRERPADGQQQADQSHARFRHPRSDFLSLLNLWNYYEERRQALSENRLRRLCKQEFLSYLRMREWRDMHRQLSIACRRQGLRPAAALAPEADYPAVHRALLAGLLANIAQQEERRDYRGAQNRLLSLFPGSALWKKPPKWILAAEVVETQRVYARMAAAIEPAWVLDINPALLRHQYLEPSWEQGRGRVMALRRTTLFGLTVSDRVPVHYGSIDVALSRELMVREGLIPGRWPGRMPAFLKHNLRLQREVADLESRIRRRDLLIDDEQLFRFYDERLPADAVNAQGLKRWLAEDEGRDRALRLRRADLLTRDPGDALAQFPDHLEWEGQRYRLSYEFSPGGEADGVSISVPVALLNRLPLFRLEWLVQGLLREKCISLLRTLPKSLRKRLVPVPDWADRALSVMQPGDRPLTEALAAALLQVGGPRVDSAHWNAASLDDYYRMNLRVLDERGRLLAQGRDAQGLVSRFREATKEQLESGGEGSPAQQGLTRWPGEVLPREWQFRQAGARVTAYPALVDAGEAVDVALHDYPGEALVAHRRGLARLLMLGEKPALRQLNKQTLRDNAASLLLAATGLDRELLVSGMLYGVFLTAAGLQQGDCWTRSDFAAAQARCRRSLQAVANEYQSLLRVSLEAQAEARQLAQRQGEQFAEAAAEISAHGARLLAADTLASLPLDVLRHFPRYCRAMQVRAERLGANYRRDREQQARLEGLRAPLAECLADCPGALVLSPSAQRYWVMLEEFAVSLFAQHLGTSQPVSEKRIAAQWDAVDAWWRRSRGQEPEAV
jgi:ATP-dependent helicase HrpA